MRHSGLRYSGMTPSVPLWRMPVWHVRYGACQTDAGTDAGPVWRISIWRRSSMTHFTMAHVQYDAFQYGAFHYSAGLVWRISVWRIPVRCSSGRCGAIPVCRSFAVMSVGLWRMHFVEIIIYTSWMICQQSTTSQRLCQRSMSYSYTVLIRSSLEGWHRVSIAKTVQHIDMFEAICWLTHGKAGW